MNLRYLNLPAQISWMNGHKISAIELHMVDKATTIKIIDKQIGMVAGET